MKLKDQVCSLELSKKLLTLGVKQNSLWYWCDAFSDDWTLCYTNRYEDDIYLNDLKREKAAYSAFTSSELMSLLPQRITLPEDEPFNSFTLYVKKSFVVVDGNIDNLIPTYIINYECDSTSVTGEEAFLRRQLFPHNIWDDNFSNALAKTLIYLIEEQKVNVL